MTREAKTKALAEKIIETCHGENPSQILTALMLAAAVVVTDVGRDDVSNADLVSAFARSLSTALGQMREEPGTLQ
jgi:hypothetical protein